MKTLRCREAGMDCDYVVRGSTMDEVLSKAIEHAKSQHGMKSVSSEMRTRLSSLVRDEAA